MKIYHTNDLHSHFEQMARVAAYLRVHRQPEDLVLDCGDLCDVRSITVQGSGGLAGIHLAQAIGMDAMAVGNNEIDMEHDALANCSAQFPMLSVNLRDNSGRRVGQIQDGILLQRGGIRFLLLGASPFYAPDGTPHAYNVFYQMGNLMTIDPYPLLQNALDHFAGQYDFCILLSHSGWEIEQQILEKFPEIGLCLGGHCHRALSAPRYQQTGKYGKNLGVVELAKKDGKISIVRQELVCMEDIAQDEAFLAQLAQEEAVAERMMRKPLYDAPELEWSLTEESPLANFIADALFSCYPCELAFTNAGIVEGALPTSISKAALLLCSPSKLNPTRCRITGRQLRLAAMRSLDADYVQQEHPGPGARWSALGTLAFSHNVTLRKSPFAMWINAEPLEDAREYECVTHDALQRGTGYPELAVHDAVFYGGFIRDLLLRTLNRPDLHESAHKRRFQDK